MASEDHAQEADLGTATTDGVSAVDGLSAAPAVPQKTAQELATERMRAAAVLQAEATQKIFAMARQQQFAQVTSLLAETPQFWTATDEEGHTLLHWAALVGNKDFVVKALEKGVPVDSQANNLQTPLMWTVLRGHIQCARALLDAKASLKIHDSLGATALMIAVQHGNYNTFLLLMKRGGEAQLSDVDKNGCTLAHWAAYKGDLQALKLLDYFGSSLLQTDNVGMLPLHRATCASEAQVFEFLIEKKSDMNMRNKEGKTCLDIAEGQNALPIATYLRRLAKRAESGNEVADGDVEIGAPSKNGKEEKKGDGIWKSLTKDKGAQKMFPVFWLVCVSLATFQYLCDLRHTSYEVAPVAALLFEIGVPVSLAIFFWVALGNPGMLPNRPKGRSGVEELQIALDTDTSDSKNPDISRLCYTSWNLKGLRTKYCTATGGCVEEFDHYCVWLNNSIGKGNHRQFVCLAIVEFLTQLTHIYLCWRMSLSLVPYTTIGAWLYGILTGYPLLVLIGLVQCLTAPWVAVLITHQTKLIWGNMTTNEMMNLHRYEHFWKMGVMQGRMGRVFHNPFNKGSKVSNCLDFWFHRRRSQMGDVKPDFSKLAQQACGSGCGHDHGSGHGGHECKK